MQRFLRIQQRVAGMVVADRAIEEGLEQLMAHSQRRELVAKQIKLRKPPAIPARAATRGGFRAKAYTA